MSRLLIILFVVVLLLIGCSPSHRTGSPVFVEVTDGRIYECVETGSGYGRTLIGCELVEGEGE